MESSETRQRQSVPRNSLPYNSSSLMPAPIGHHLIIKRTISTSVPDGRRSASVDRRSVRTLTPTYQPTPDGLYRALSVTGLNDVKDSRTKAKSDMRDLNDRFASYLNRVGSLEAKNSALADELNKLRTKWGKETLQIKAMHQADLDDSRHDLDDAVKNRALMEIKVASAEEQIEVRRQM